jgi:uncharacterized iron-regulated membrane protein
MRRILTSLHRVLGLITAGFLFIAGSTGALIAWDHELDGLINPRFYHTEKPTPALTPERALALANQVEQREPRLQVTWLPLVSEESEALQLGVGPRIDPATGLAYELGYNQLAVDPTSGEPQAQREWGAVSLKRENLLPFLYRLHYTLHIPEGGGVDWGMLLMGVIAVGWVIDSIIALIISFPNRKVWRKSFRFRFTNGAKVANFDLHRSGGVWAWPLLLVLAITAVSMNLNEWVVRPIVSVFSELTPEPLAGLPLADEEHPRSPKLSREKVLELAQLEAAKHNIERPIGGVFFSDHAGAFGVGFFSPGQEHGDGGLGNPYLYFHGDDGRYLGAHLPGTGSAGDFFMQLQFPLHSGRIAGVTGRVIVTILGLAVAGLSVTGLVIWAQRRRRKQRTRESSAVSPLGSPSEAA